jgi:hypothetical protein
MDWLLFRKGEVVYAKLTIGNGHLGSRTLFARVFSREESVNAGKRQIV